MAGHMDEVVNLIERARRGAKDYGFLLSAALLPEPMVPMLKMYVNTYRPDGQGVALHDMQKRLDSATSVVVCEVLCIPVPNLAAVSLVVNGNVIQAQHFIDSLHRGLCGSPAREQLPPGQYLLED